MFLTFCYAAATWMQSWKIRSISAILAKQINNPLSVSFYNSGNGCSENFSNLVASDVCINHTKARVVDMLWSQDHLRGVAILPKQILWIGSWMSFPKGPNLIPIDIEEDNLNLNIDENNSIHLLLETELLPCFNNAFNDGPPSIMVEGYGQPLAWKVDSCLAILLKSDLRLFTDLVMASFMQNNLVINDFLPLIRIETVTVEGNPQPFEMVKNHARKETYSRSKKLLTEDEWSVHLNGLRSLNILSSQASEFEFKKNRTEGKTGISKPDLIPARSFDTNRTSDSVSPTDEKSANVSPIKIDLDSNRLINLDIANNKISPKISPRVSPRVSPRASPLKLVLETEAEHKIGDIDLIEAKEITPKNENIVKVNNENVNLDKTTRPKPSVPSTSTSNANNTKLADKISAHLSPSGTTKGGLIEAKPPNVLVYSDSNVTRKNVITTLKNTLNHDKYTIYELTSNDAQNGIWIENTTLLVVCGSVSRGVGSIFAEYFLRGGKMLCICSDVLHVVLPTYRTAEVRENELVQFSYGQWHKIKLMHHIFCYQPSPIKKHFSTDSDDIPPVQRKPTLTYPRSIDVQDLQGSIHRLEVKVLGTEETWNTPSLMVATNPKTAGVAVFSQVHLEADPNLFENDEIKFAVLKESNQARLDIFANLLTSTLGIDANPSVAGEKLPTYSKGFFLGRHEEKFAILNGFKEQYGSLKQVKSNKLTMQFLGKNEEKIDTPTETLLPILIHACPDDFSTIDYYDSLKTDKIGRLVVYSPVMSSTMDLVGNLNFGHGVAIIARKQTNGVGRSNNQWLTPDGCAIFTLQLHIPLSTALGQRIPLLQQLVSVAVVKAVTNIPGYQNIDIRLKWPNDIYANGIRKIGGLLITTTMNEREAICNVGVGINLNNSNPTTCINDLIKEYNIKHNKQLPEIQFERYFALVFNEIEQLLNVVQRDNLDYFYDQYYQIWLHTDVEVNIADRDGNKKRAKILGIDEYGYLKVQELGSGKVSDVVHPNGNSFDMLRGLIFPK